MLGLVYMWPEQLGLEQVGDPIPVLVGRPAELDREQVVQLGAGEGAETLSCFGYRKSWAQVFAEVLPDALGLAGQPIV